MSKPPHDSFHSSLATYFVTATAWQARMLFQSNRVAELFLAILYRYRAQGKFLLHAFVIMPNHFHALLTVGEGLTLERVMQFIKGGFSHEVGQQLNRHFELWQRGYVDHRIRGIEDYARHREYIHFNPVRGHLCETAEQYPYSSAHRRWTVDEAPQGLKPEEVEDVARHG